MNGSRIKVEHIDHALEVAEIYFTLKPFQWLYEYQQDFDFNGKSRVFNPDCILAYTTKEGKKKPLCIEVQRTPLSEKQWKAKFQVFNEFFTEAYKKAEFQKWNEKKEVIPHFVVISNQGNVTGLDIADRPLTVITDISQLG